MKDTTLAEPVGYSLAARVIPPLMVLLVSSLSPLFSLSLVWCIQISVADNPRPEVSEASRDFRVAITTLRHIFKSRLIAHREWKKGIIVPIWRKRVWFKICGEI